ncbi:MAG: precorrin-3B C(17)-methyltransferase [Pseudomonadota bacterium]
MIPLEPMAKRAIDGRNAAIIVLGPSGLKTALAIKAALDGAEIHGALERLDDGAVDRTFEDIGSHLQALFQLGHPLIVLAAAAIPIRLLAPVLQSKTIDPPVLVVAEDGNAVVPLLGGHHGANDLARRIATILKTEPAITTAGDLRLRIALDQPPPGWRLANPEAVKPLTAALLSGERLCIEIGAGRAEEARWLDPLRDRTAQDAVNQILVTDRKIQPTSTTLVYHPRTLALGVGCERHTAPEELIDLAQSVLGEQGLAETSIAAVVSITLKAAEPAVHALADHFGVPARFFDAKTLEGEKSRLANPSDIVFQETGCHGVAEGAVLAAVGAQGNLIVEKVKSDRATLAIARSDRLLNADEMGRPQGRLAIVGIGPGPHDWRSPEADRWLADADHWVGYKGYLDLLRPGGHIELHGFGLGEEEDRARSALNLAASGKNVALISSGDAGIYAMGALVFELLAREEQSEWQRVDVAMAPGISALQAASARAGAPLGHDFCAISLSDLLTPWHVIERRLNAAADGDFVVALYNPASLRRREGLARAVAIFERARPLSTPVIVARNLGRPGESIAVTTLPELDQDRVDMMTLLIIGSSRTRKSSRLHGVPFVYTPRGYLAGGDDEDPSA